MGGEIPGLVVFHDLDPAPPRILATLWAAGDAIDRTPHSYGIRTWDDLVAKLLELRRLGVVVRQIHVWCHGYRKGPVLGCKILSSGAAVSIYAITDEHLARIGEAAPDLEIVWWRCCDTGTSYEFPLRVQQALPEVTTVHHAAVISGEKTYSVLGVPITIPSPWWQDNGAALKPGQKPWWQLDGSDLKGCLVTKMQVPDRFYKDGRP